MAENKNKPPLIAVKGRKRFSAFPLKPGAPAQEVKKEGENKS